MIKKWFVNSSYIIECAFNLGGNILFTDESIELPSEVAKELLHNFTIKYNGDEYFEIVIPFSSNGYYDSGKLYGPPEKCYPPEYDDERLLSDNCIVYFYTDNGTKTCELSNKSSQLLFDLFEEKIKIADIEKEFDDWRY